MRDKRKDEEETRRRLADGGESKGRRSETSMLTATSAGDPGRPQSRARTLVRRALVGADIAASGVQHGDAQMGVEGVGAETSAWEGAGMHTTF